MISEMNNIDFTYHFCYNMVTFKKTFIRKKELF